MTITFEQSGFADRNVTAETFKNDSKEEIIEYIRCVMADLAEDIFCQSGVEEDIVPVEGIDALANGMLECWDKRDHKALIAAFDALRLKGGRG